MWKGALYCIALSISGLFLTGQVIAAPVGFKVVSDGLWRSSDTEQIGWQEVEFDDSAWPNARSPYPNVYTPEFNIPGTLAEFIWHDPANTSRGTSGPTLAFFRREFMLEISGGTRLLQGVASVGADDYFEFYVNGALVNENKDGSMAARVKTFSIPGSAFRNGVNVFAIKAQDGYVWGEPEDRVYEWVLVDATISAVPLPGGLALLLPAALSFFVFARRQAS